MIAGFHAVEDLWEICHLECAKCVKRQSEEENSYEHDGWGGLEHRHLCCFVRKYYT